MKIYGFFMSVAFAGLIYFASCSTDSDIRENGSVQVAFVSSLNTSQTKVSIDNEGNSVWSANDPVGIYMVKQGTTAVAEGAENVKHIAAQAGRSTTFSPGGETVIYYPENEAEKVDFIAYYPYNADITNYVYPVNVANQTSQTAIDLMYAVADNTDAGYSKADTAVNLAFEHKLVKLVLNVEKDPGLTGDITAVSINGMNTTASFDLKGMGMFTGLGGAKAITPYAVKDGSKYEAILLPVQSISAAHQVTFVCDGKTFTWAMKNNMARLGAGNIYTYKITLTQQPDVNVIVTGDITSWTTGTPTTGTAQ